jgi:hypothetical protein
MLDIAWWDTRAIVGVRRVAMGPYLLALTLIALGWLAPAAGAEPWSGARISRLPDSAFAVVETTPEGRKVRHLPHHDETGLIDLPHLRVARSRLDQVRWLDPASEEIARRHLEEHWREIRRD